jgi:hypothetical membrane protein
MNVIVAQSEIHDSQLRRALDFAGLALGVAAPIVYAATVMWGATLVPGYSHLTDFISALNQSGQIGTEAVQSLFLLYNGLVLVFATMCLRRLSRSPEWMMTFLLLFAIAALGILMAPFPQDPVGDPMTTIGTIHIVLAGLASICSMGAIWFSGLAWRRTKKGEDLALFSFVCLGIVFGSGLFAAAAAVGGWNIAGLLERVTIGTFLLWMLVTAAMFVRRLASQGVAIPHPGN